MTVGHGARNASEAAGIETIFAVQETPSVENMSEVGIVCPGDGLAGYRRALHVLACDAVKGILSII